MNWERSTPPVGQRTKSVFFAIARWEKGMLTGKGKTEPLKFYFGKYVSLHKHLFDTSLKVSLYP
jgi:hypothetical protein